MKNNLSGRQACLSEAVLCQSGNFAERRDRASSAMVNRTAILSFPFLLSHSKRGSMLLRNLLGLVFLMGISMPLSAQSIGRQLIGAAGGGATQVGNMKISWSIGEISVAHSNATSGDGKLTAGFQQPWLMPLHDGEDPLNVQIAPNPVRSILNLYIPGDSKSEWNVTVSDVNGKTLFQHTGLSAGNSEMDLSRVPAGVYFLSVLQAATGEVRQTLKVLKL